MSDPFNALGAIKTEEEHYFAHDGGEAGFCKLHQLKDKTQHQVHFFVTSLKPNVAQFADAVRRHWSIENPLHWTLDIAFDENHSRARTAFEAENLSVLRHFALNLLKLDTSVKD